MLARSASECVPTSSRTRIDAQLAELTHSRARIDGLMHSLALRACIGKFLSAARLTLMHLHFDSFDQQPSMIWAFCSRAESNVADSGLNYCELIAKLNFMNLVNRQR